MLLKFYYWRFGNQHASRLLAERNYFLSSYASRILDIHQKHYRTRLAECYHSWKFNPYVLYKRACRTMQQRVIGRVRELLIRWHQTTQIFQNREKFVKVFQSIASNQERIERTVAKCWRKWTQDLKARFRSGIRALLYRAQNGVRSYFSSWRINAGLATQGTTSRESQVLQVIFTFIGALTRRVKKLGYEAIKRQMLLEQKKEKVISRLVFNLRNQKHDGVKHFQR